MIRTKKIIFGLVGSGKTTLYRKLNEEKEENAIEIELPQNCINNDLLKEQLFRLFLFDKSIETIILHPYYLCLDFLEIIKESGIKVTFEFLDVSFKKRLKRIKKRSKQINSKCKIFPIEYLKLEEKYFEKLKNIIKEKINYE